jgi:competence protein ComEC
MRQFLLFFIIAWVFGCILGVVDVGNRWLFVCVLVLGFIAWHTKRGAHQTVTLPILLFLGLVYGASDSQVELNYCNFSFQQTGVVVSKPDMRASQTQFEVKIQQCVVLVSASPFLDVYKGDEVVISRGSVQSLEDIRDYSEGYASYLERRGISYTWRYPEVEVNIMNTENIRWVSKQVQKLNMILRNRVQKLFVEPDASIVSAMLLAEKGRIPESIVQQFRATGVSHILAISGLHVAIIAGLILVVVSNLPLRPWGRTGLITGVLWLYVVFIGFPMSAIRAASFVSITLVFFRLNKLISFPTVLILTVATLISINPQVILDVGFQLSVSAVTGIFLLLFTVKEDRRKKGVLIWVFRLLLVSMGATLFTWPLVAYHFGTISLIGLLANLLVVPIVPVLLWTVIGAMVISFIWLPGAVIIGGLAHLCIEWLLFITRKLSLLPGTYYEDVSISLKLITLYYLLIGLMLIVILWRQKRSWLEVWG